jgi:iron complex outermembrane receptor protein
MHRNEQRRFTDVFRASRGPLSAAVGIALAAASSGVRADSPTDALEEVVVTASRREQSVIEVPYNISAVSSRDLRSAGVSDIRGLANLVPGLVIPDLGSRGNSVNSNIIIRGMNTSDSSTADYLPFAAVPPVSTYVDDVAVFTNLNLADVDRVEVLRGPQGTLYGSGSVAGTVRLIHARPDPNQFSASLDAEGAAVSGASRASSKIMGLINVPLGASAAIRMSTGYDQIAGFIDAPNATVYDANHQPVLANPGDPLNSGLTHQLVRHIDDGLSAYTRASLLWNPSQDSSVLAAYQHQRDASGGPSADTLGTPGLLQEFVPEQPMHRTLDLASLTVSRDFGFATLTSSTGYYVNKSDSVADVTFAVEASEAQSATYSGFPRITSSIHNTTRAAAVSEELRFVSRTGFTWDYVVGGFFRREYDSVDQIETIPGIGTWSELPGSAALVNTLYGTNAPTFADYQELYIGGPRPSAIVPTDVDYFYSRQSSFLDRAIYGELTRHLTSRWQVTLGGRQFWQVYSQNLSQALPFLGTTGSTLTPPDSYGTGRGSAEQSFRNHLIKLNTSYKLAQGLQAYATFAEGFRHGGSNAVPVGTCGFCDARSVVPYNSDTAKNYEIGIKGESADRRWRYSGDLYRVDWRDIQVQALGAALEPVVVNGGTARSQGLELEFTAKLSDRWFASVGYNYVDAKFTSNTIVADQGLTPILLRTTDGAPLPGAPKQVATVAVEFREPLGAHRQLVVRGGWNYQSDVVTVQHVRLGGFGTGSASASVVWDEHFTTGVYVDNLSNGRHVVAEATPSVDAQHYTRNYLGRPRTAGLRFSYSH